MTDENFHFREIFHEVHFCSRKARESFQDGQGTSGKVLLWEGPKASDFVCGTHFEL